MSRVKRGQGTGWYGDDDEYSRRLNGYDAVIALTNNGQRGVFITSRYDALKILRAKTFPTLKAAKEYADKALTDEPAVNLYKPDPKPELSPVLKDTRFPSTVNEVDATEAAKQTGYSEYRVKLMAKDGKLVGAHKAGKKWMIPTPVMIRAKDGSEAPWKKGTGPSQAPTANSAGASASPSPANTSQKIECKYPHPEGCKARADGNVEIHLYTEGEDLIGSGNARYGTKQHRRGEVIVDGKTLTNIAANYKDGFRLAKEWGLPRIANLKPPEARGNPKPLIGPPLTQESLNRGQR